MDRLTPQNPVNARGFLMNTLITQPEPQRLSPKNTPFYHFKCTLLNPTIKLWRNHQHTPPHQSSQKQPRRYAKWLYLSKKWRSV